MTFKLLLHSCGAALAALVPGLAAATPILLSSALIGDPRPSEPDNLRIDVSIIGDTTSNQVNWIVNINSPLYPTAKLDQFFFNMTGAAGAYSFSGFSPAGWDIQTPANNANGSGGADFIFTALDPKGPPNAPDVTNSVNLLFTMTKSSGNFSIADFMSASFSCSNDALLGCGQMGAHLQSLGANGASGFLMGNYVEGGVNANDPGGNNVPEPASFGLAGIALAGAWLASRRRKSSLRAVSA